MTRPSTYANEARKKVGQYLVNEAGYSKRTPLKYYKQGENILTYVYLERGFLTQVEVGVVPLYIPNSLQFLNGTRIPNCAIREDCGPMEANQWAETVIKRLKDGILSFMESISFPQALMQYLLKRHPYDQHFQGTTIQVDKLLIFTSAYLGDIGFAVRRAQQEMLDIKEKRIDSLANKMAQYDAEIERLKSTLEYNGLESRDSTDQMIRDIERNKELVEFDATHNAPETMQMYKGWIEPFLSPAFVGENYFAHIIAQNKDDLKYEKLFKAKVNHRAKMV